MKIDVPLIQVVDKNDNPVRYASKKEVWKTGERHRIVWIMVEDERGRILLQKRPDTMDLHPGCWDYAVGGHVDGGETWEEAALREAEEELGLNNIKLTELGKFYEESEFNGKKLNRFYKSFKTIIEPSSIKPDTEEVAGVKWFALSEIKDLLKNQPELFPDGRLRVIERYYDGD